MTTENEVLLWVQTDYFTAGAVWKKIYGVWSCVHAAPIIRWMVGKRELEVKNALLKMGAKWEWIKP